jgi:hypothetical protein
MREVDGPMGDGWGFLYSIGSSRLPISSLSLSHTHIIGLCVCLFVPCTYRSVVLSREYRFCESMSDGEARRQFCEFSPFRWLKQRQDH